MVNEPFRVVASGRGEDNLNASELAVEGRRFDFFEDKVAREEELFEVKEEEALVGGDL